MIKVILASLTVILSPMAFATLGPTDGTAGTTAQGAVTNNQAACDHRNKENQWKHDAEQHPDADGQPNHEMMEHAHHEASLARQNSLQATEFAKDALQALDSRGQQTTAGAAQPTMPDGSPINIPLLQQLANMPNSGGGDTANTGSDAFQMNGDNATSTSAQQAATNNGTAATPSTVVNVGPQGVGTNGGANASGARSPNLPGGQFASTNPSLDGSTANPLNQKPSDLKAQSTDIVAADHIVTPSDGLKDKKTLEANRAQVLRQMGLREPASVEESGPYRAKTEDIFAVMHSHYKNMSDIGMFYDFGSQLPPSPGPSRTPPSFSPGW